MKNYRFSMDVALTTNFLGLKNRISIVYTSLNVVVYRCVINVCRHLRMGFNAENRNFVEGGGGCAHRGESENYKLHRMKIHANKNSQLSISKQLALF